MSERDELDLTLNDFPVCPYCGMVENDLTDHYQNESTIFCEGCEKEYAYTMDVSVTFTTRMISEGEKVDK